MFWGFPWFIIALKSQASFCLLCLQLFEKLLYLLKRINFEFNICACINLPHFFWKKMMHIHREGIFLYKPTKSLGEKWENIKSNASGNKDQILVAGPKGKKKEFSVSESLLIFIKTWCWNSSYSRLNILPMFHSYEKRLQVKNMSAQIDGSNGKNSILNIWNKCGRLPFTIFD